MSTGDEFLDTLFGPFIVRKPDSKETHKELYDTDGPDNVIVIHNWNPQRENYVYEDKSSVTKLLINGKTQVLRGSLTKWPVVRSGCFTYVNLPT